MPSTKCCITSCNNLQRKTSKVSGPLKISYYSFPKDAQLREKWIFNCKKGSDFNPSNSTVCSEHFTQDSFKDDFEARMMGLIRPRRLKKGAFPTVKLSSTPTSQMKKVASDSRHTRIEESRSSQTVMELHKDIKIEDNFEVIEEIKPFEECRSNHTVMELHKDIKIEDNFEVIEEIKPFEESRCNQTVMELHKDIKIEEDFEVTEDIKPFEESRCNQTVMELHKDIKIEDDFEVIEDIKPFEESRCNQTMMELHKDIKKEEDFEVTQDIRTFDVPPNLVCSICKNSSLTKILNEKGILEEQVKYLKEYAKRLKERIEIGSKQKIVVVRNNSVEEAEIKNLKDALRTVFTDEQINLMIKKKKRPSWSAEDMRRAVALRRISKRVYLLLKDRLNIPLPGISTLQFWASREKKKRNCTGETMCDSIG